MDISAAVIVAAAITGAAVMIATSIAGLILAYKTYKEAKKTVTGIAEVHHVVNSKNDALVNKVGELERLVSDLRSDRKAAQEVADDLALLTEKEKKQ